ncbi:hypothetical protein [Nodularia chucula]|uniref:hypothetical protein n=1 Tax=Nodularia chucula TaxID=3093667 RepID=UPI0039C65239
MKILSIFRNEQYQKLLSQPDHHSDFERVVLQEIYQRGYKPDTAQELIPEANFDTPRDKSTGILGSTKPLNLESLRRLNQRWDSPQALIRVCPTLFA